MFTGLKKLPVIQGSYNTETNAKNLIIVLQYNIYTFTKLLLRNF